ncbi:hypothetical protein D3C72_434500 [compost metagenome]
MTTEQKNQVIEALNDYSKDKGMGVSALAKFTGVNERYVSEILRGAHYTKVKDKDTLIADRWFKELADKIGFRLEKVYWETVTETPQFQASINFLVDAKNKGTSGMLIGDTGLGKTDAVNKFINRFPQHTYRLTVNKLYTLPYIIERLLKTFGLPEKGSAAAKLDSIIDYLIKLKHDGAKPLIIFDEAENFKMPVFGMVKALFDGLFKYCPIVLIGTTELTDKMNRLKRKNKDGMPQFCRRFKAGTRYLKAIDPRKDFEPFFAMTGVSDKGLQQLLISEADNYGELNNYLEPALRAADEEGRELDEEYFRLIYNMPKISKNGPY